MKVLGIDPSTSTGLACIDGDIIQTKLLYFKDHKGWSRLQLIATCIRNLLGEWKPDRVVIEGYNYNNAHTLVILVEIGTLIRRELHSGGFNWYVVPPTTLKKFATGKGNAKKHDMAVAAKTRWGFGSKSDDVIDAYLLARLGEIIETDAASSLKGIELDK